MGPEEVETGIEPDSPHVCGAIPVLRSRSVLRVARSRWQAGRGFDGRRMARPSSARFRPKRKSPDQIALCRGFICLALAISTREMNLERVKVPR